MRDFISGLVMLCVVSCFLTGCSTIPLLDSGDPPQHIILVESGVIALAFYEAHDDIEDSQQKGIAAIAAADTYLMFMYGNGALNMNPKYTFSQLLHSEVLNKIVDQRLKKLAYAARIVMNKDGTLTGVAWADALLMGLKVSTVEPILDE